MNMLLLLLCCGCDGILPRLFLLLLLLLMRLVHCRCGCCSL
jgi:hypothetical protein